MLREDLNRYLDGMLEVARFRDYCANGLQVEGRSEPRPIVSGVSASPDLIQVLPAQSTDAILVHPGHFWKSGKLETGPFLTHWRSAELLKKAVPFRSCDCISGKKRSGRCNWRESGVVIPAANRQVTETWIYRHWTGHPAAYRGLGH